MKLNKNGWGILSFLAFLAIFILCLLVSCLGLRKVGLLDEDWHFVVRNDGSGRTLEDVRREEKEISKNTYDNLESKMVESTKKYILDKYNNSLHSDTLTIRVSLLVDNGYLEPLKDNKNRECSGYTEVYIKDNMINYDPYLKCKKYETKGYLERKDSNE